MQIPQRPNAMNSSNFTTMSHGEGEQRAGASCSDASASLHPKSSQGRSCSRCSQRKIRCDRQQPCVNCVRSLCDCLYPPGRGRAPKRPLRSVDAQMVSRLSRLETLIKSLESRRNTGTVDSSLSVTMDSEHASQGHKAVYAAGGPTAQQDTADGSGHQDELHDDPGTSTSTEASFDLDMSIDQQMGRLMIDDTRSSYVSNVLWASLSNEIEELRDMLYEATSEADECQPTETAAPLLGLNAALFGYRALSQSLKSLHPPLQESVALLQVFCENVLPLVRIFHMPTTARIYWEAVDSLDALDKNTEALLFSIYYSAAISMDSHQCEVILGASRGDIVTKYRFAVEQAMARANLLNTQSIILLQAMVIFLSALRNEDDSRSTWSLTSLIFHIAQAMGLHRDGAEFGLKPIDTELRRRLWYHICLLDARSSEYHGYEPIAREFVFDTKLPLHINDADLTSQMTKPPPERHEATEMTFCLIRCEAMKISYRIAHVPQGRSADDLSIEDRAALVEDLKQRLQEKYLQYCDSSNPFQLMLLTVTRLILARMWLVVHYPRLRRGDNASSFTMGIRDQLFLTSIQVLEHSSLLLTNKEIYRWTWHSKTHIQWHAVAFVLSEICSRPPSPDCDRAWEYITIVCDCWKMKNEKKGTLWRPIKRLMAKARYVREMQKAEPRSYLNTPVPTRVWPTESEQQALGSIGSAINTPSFTTACTPTASTVASQPTDCLQTIAEINNLGVGGDQFYAHGLHPYMDLVPEVTPPGGTSGGMGHYSQSHQNGDFYDFGDPYRMNALYFG